MASIHPPTTLAAAKMTRPSPEDEEVMPEGCHTGGVSLASGDKENVAGKGGVVAMTPGCVRPPASMTHAVFESSLLTTSAHVQTNEQ